MISRGLMTGGRNCKDNGRGNDLERSGMVNEDCRYIRGKRNRVLVGRVFDVLKFWKHNLGLGTNRKSFFMSSIWDAIVFSKFAIDCLLLIIA